MPTQLKLAEGRPISDNKVYEGPGSRPTKVKLMVNMLSLNNEHKIV